MPDGKPRVRLHWMGRGQWLAAASVRGLIAHGRSTTSGNAIDKALRRIAPFIEVNNG